MSGEGAQPAEGLAEDVAAEIYTADRNGSPHFDDYDRLDPIALAWYQRMAAAALKVTEVDKARAVEEARRDALLEAARRLGYEGIGWKKSDAAIWSLAATDLRRLAAQPTGEGSET